MTQFPNLSKLTELATETSSERRRELLRDVTDLYFANQSTCSETENEHFSAILTQVTNDMHEEVRKEMSERFAKENTGPIQLLRNLASDDYDIAGPVLRHSTVLQDKHLKEVIASKGQEHLRAISVRETLSEAVTSDIVNKGDDETLVTLAGNQGARFDRPSMQTLVTRSKDLTELQAPLVEHQDLPPDLMNDMYMFAEQKVRARIVARNAEIDPEMLQKALDQAKTHATAPEVKMPDGYAAVRRQIIALHQSNKLDGTMLIRFERENQRLHFAVGIAHLSGLDFPTIDRILQRADTEALALVCRTLGFDSALFTTIALLTNKDKSSNTGDSAILRQMYNAIPEDAAHRTLRFWKMRQKVETDHAA